MGQGHKEASTLMVAQLLAVQEATFPEAGTNVLFSRFLERIDRACCEPHPSLNGKRGNSMAAIG